MAALRRKTAEERKGYATELKKRDDENAQLHAELARWQAGAVCPAALVAERAKNHKLTKELEALQLERAREHGQHIEEMQEAHVALANGEKLRREALGHAAQLVAQAGEEQAEARHEAAAEAAEFEVLRARASLVEQEKNHLSEIRSSLDDVSWFAKASLELSSDLQHRVKCEQLRHAALSLVSEIAEDGTRLVDTIHETPAVRSECAVPCRGVLCGVGLAGRRMALPLWQRLRSDFRLIYRDETDTRERVERRAAAAIGGEAQMLLVALGEDVMEEEGREEEDASGAAPASSVVSLRIPPGSRCNSLVAAAAASGVPIVVLDVSNTGTNPDAILKYTTNPEGERVPCQRLPCVGRSLEELQADLVRLLGPNDTELSALLEALGPATVKALTRAQGSPSHSPGREGAVELRLPNPSDALLEALAEALLRNFRLAPGAVGVLDVPDAQCTAQGMKVLGALVATPPFARLQTLLLSGSKANAVTDKALGRLVKTLPGLTTVSLHGAPKVGDRGVEILAESCRCLTSVDLGRSKAANVGVEALSMGCKGILHLDLEGCSITDTALVALGKGLPLLRQLNLRQCNAVTDTGLIALTQGCPELQSLQLARCLALGDKGWAALRLCRNLREVDLSQNAVPVEALEVLCRDLSGVLERVRIVDCPGLEDPVRVYACVAGLEALESLAAPARVGEHCMDLIVGSPQQQRKERASARGQGAHPHRQPAQRVYGALLRGSDGAAAAGWHDSNGNSPLHIAAAKGLPRLAEALIRTQQQEGSSKGSLLNRGNEKGLRALHSASHTGAIEIVRMLLDAKADPRANDDQGRTPLHHACMSGPHNDASSPHAEIVTLLLQARAAVDASDDHGRLALHYACQATVVPLVRSLMEHGGADLTVADKRGYRPKDLIGRSCPLTDFLASLEEGKEKNQVFKEECVLASGAPAIGGGSDYAAYVGTARQKPHRGRAVTLF